MMWFDDVPHNEWEITASKSLFEPFTSSEIAKKYQQAYDQHTQKTFDEWKSALWQLLKHIIDYDSFALIAFYCEASAANYYQLNTSNSYYDGCNWLEDVLHSTIPKCLIGKVQFGDVVEVPGYRGSGVYVVTDVNNSSLLQVGQDGSGQIDIPVRITDELCDPIEFYRFCAPTQGLPYQEYVTFSFNHSYIQKVLGLHASNKSSSSFQKWTFYINEQNTMHFDGEYIKYKKFYHEPTTLYIRTGPEDIGDEISVPLTYAQRREKPLFVYLQDVYHKRMEAKKFKQNLNLTETDDCGWSSGRAEREFGTKLPAHVRKDLFMMHALIEDDDYSGVNKFDIELNKPISWRINYPSVDYADFVGLRAELKQMMEFIECADYIHLCYVVKAMGDHGADQASFWELNGLISPTKYGTAWCSIGGYSLVTHENIHIAAGILRGMQLCKSTKWKILKPVVTLEEYKRFLDCEPNRNLKGYLIHSDAKCIRLVLYLWKYHKIVKDVKKWKLTAKEHEVLMSKIRQILN